MHLPSGFSNSIQRLRISFAVAALTVAFFANESAAQQGFISDANASQAGLTVAWSTQADISSKGSLVDWQLVVDEDQATTYYVISWGKRKEVIAQTDLSPFGVPYGVDGARTAAENRKEIIEAELRNDRIEDVEVKITDYTLPRSTIFALGASGRVICLDADTGKTRWVQQVGNYLLPSIGLGASKTHVAVANGSSVFCLDFESGRVLWSGRCKDGIDSSPTCSNENVYVPLRSGRLQTFPIDKNGLGSFNLVAEGNPRSRPIITEKHVVWTTERGHMNVAPLDRRTVEYRLKSSGPVISQASAAGGKLYVGSLDGFVYGLSEISGRLDWEVSTGQGVLKSPVAFGNDVYVVSSANELFKVDSVEGTYPEGWQSPIRGIREIAGFGAETVYCISSGGRLIGINRDTRAITKSIPGSSIELVMPNGITDRMFFATKSGFIQCVHEVSSLRPRFLQSDLALAKPEKSKKPRKDDSAMGEENPFGDEAENMGEANPFADSADDSGADSDDTNPFGDDGGSSEEEDDSNPFGDG
jgi:outer membrane protein assembly factor BamB